MIKSICPTRFSKNICSQKLLWIFIKTPLTELIFCKFPCFQHIFMNNFWRIRAWSMKIILWKLSYFRHLFKQNSDCKSLIAKTFHESTLKMKAASPIQVIQNKKQCLQLFLDRRRTLVLRTHFLRARWNKSVQS